MIVVAIFHFIEKDIGMRIWDLKITVRSASNLKSYLEASDFTKVQLRLYTNRHR